MLPISFGALSEGEAAKGLSAMDDVARHKLIKVFKECDLDGNGMS